MTEHQIRQLTRNLLNEIFIGYEISYFIFLALTKLAEIDFSSFLLSPTDFHLYFSPQIQERNYLYICIIALIVLKESNVQKFSI